MLAVVAVQEKPVHMELAVQAEAVLVLAQEILLHQEVQMEQQIVVEVQAVPVKEETLLQVGLQVVQGL